MKLANKVIKLHEAKLRIGAKPFKDQAWVITQYEKLKYDDLGSPLKGYLKIVNQDNADTILIQNDHALRKPMYWAKVPTLKNVRLENSNINSLLVTIETAMVKQG